jgi:hypothetical protein
MKLSDKLHFSLHRAFELVAHQVCLMLLLAELSFELANLVPQQLQVMGYLRPNFFWNRLEWLL